MANPLDVTVTDTAPKKRRDPRLRPRHPERICWGCDKYCPAGDLRCGSGFIRAPHPIELFGENWCEDEAESGDADTEGTA